jgi:hypothetical protein
VEAGPSELEAKEPFVPAEVLVVDQVNGPVTRELRTQLVPLGKPVQLVLDEPARRGHPTRPEAPGKTPIRGERSATGGARDDDSPPGDSHELRYRA